VPFSIFIRQQGSTQICFQVYCRCSCILFRFRSDVVKYHPYLLNNSVTYFIGGTSIHDVGISGIRLHFFLMKCRFNNDKKYKNSPIWLTRNATFVKFDCLLIKMQGQKVAKDKLKVLIATATAKAVTTCTLEQSGNSCLGSCLLIYIKLYSKG